MFTTGDKLLNVMKEEEISIAELAKLIVVSEMNDVELEELVHRLLEGGLRNKDFKYRKNR